MTVGTPDARVANGLADPDGTVGDLAAALGPLADEAARRGRPTLVSVTVAVADIDPPALYAAADPGVEPWLWQRPADGIGQVGLDSAWRIRSSGAGRFAEVAAAWSALSVDRVDGRPDGVRGTGPLLVGGFGFGPEPVHEEPWVGFAPADLVLPRILVTTTPAGAWLTASLVVDDPGQADREVDAPARAWTACRAAVVARPGAIDGLAADGDAGAGPFLRIVSSRPGAPEWRASVARFAGAVGRGRLDKVVLARRLEVEGHDPIDVASVLRRLAAESPECTTFAVTRGDRTFLGATPELLVRREGRELETVALAGSSRRATDPATDARLAAELLGSDKEREEHGVVVDAIREILAPLVDPLVVADQPSVLALRHVQHLRTPIRGRLREPIGVLDLVGCLHPTPAVGGAPRELALELIEEEEPLRRGWYAGPVGWLDAQGDGEFVVALRSGVVRGTRATLFAGCGIVADSDPDREWEESSVKLRALSSALGRVEA